MLELDALGASVASLSRFVVGSSTMGDTLQRVLDLTAEAIPGADMSAVSMLVDGRVRTAVYSDDLAPEVDQLQYDADDGPCLSAYRRNVVTQIPSTATDTQWPDFSTKARAKGINATMSLPLAVSDTKLGALNVYSHADHAFGEVDTDAAAGFAAHASVVLANAQAYWDARSLGENLQQAMRSRATIEQAKGIVMAQSDVDSDRAFDILKRASQRQNRKLRDVAAEMVARQGQNAPPAPEPA